MNWIDTPSSTTMARFGYVAEQQVLIVEFKHGGRYEYYDVPAAVFEGMVQASSKGQYHAKHIKGIFRYART